MPSHVYFDLDGTLTDPFEGISKCFLYAVDKLGFPPPTNDYLHSCIGPPLYDTFPPIVGAELTLKAVDLYRERFNEIGWQENVPYEGIHEALAAVKKSDCTLFVATSKPREAANRIVEHFELAQFFDGVYGCELDGTRSNKAELLGFAVDENSDAAQRLMIGDRRHDLIGAIANDITPIGVSYGYGSVEELKSAGARAIAHSPEELPNVIENTIPDESACDSPMD